MRWDLAGAEQVVICGRITHEKKLLPFDKEQIKGEDKNLLLIGAHFIFCDPDEQTTQSSLVERAKGTTGV